MATTIDQSRIKLVLPLNEDKGSATVYDYSLFKNHGSVSGTAYFDAAKEGNGVYFPDGAGTVDISTLPVNLTGDFTIMFWAQTARLGDNRSGNMAGIVLATARDLHDVWTEVREKTWGHWVISKAGNTVSVYLNSRLLKAVTLTDPLTGIALAQNIYDGANGYGAIDEVKMYDLALTREEIQEEASTAARLAYYINSKNLLDWDIHVSESNGILDRPKMKSPRSISWDDYHGEVVDLRGKRLEPRTITLSCFMRAKGKLDFVNKLNEFLQVFDADGTQRLTIDVHPTKPLIYEVYNEAGTAVRKRWNDDIMVGTFQLTLKEPDPVKRVVRWASTSGSRVLNMNITSRLALTISWGDGTYTEDVYGEGVALTHTYPTDGIYHAVILGVIEEIEAFTTNGILVWERL
ncbi:MAG: LamG-like jellyroll fold domain-containing protein [Proteiniphilum sp.]